MAELLWNICYSIKFIVYENKLVQKILKFNKNSYIYILNLKDNCLNIKI